LILAALLVVILAFLVVFGVALRRRSRPVKSQAGDDVEPSRSAPGAELEGAEYVMSSRTFSPAGAAGGLEVAPADSSVCPTCMSEYEASMAFCPRDARPLVPASEMMDQRRRRGGGVCPSCKRSFDQGVRFCPHDASELTPIAVYTATSRATRSPPTGIIAKICPQCRRRYDLSASFCARDSTELVVLN
jgi:predicted amidophosphoribosyltransferase